MKCNLIFQCLNTGYDNKKMNHFGNDNELRILVEKHNHGSLAHIF